MKRRELNPGDVFVYVDHPVAPNTEGPEDPHGTVRVVYGKPSWVEGAVPSPDLDSNPEAYVCREAMDADVVVLQKPEGRIESRTQLKARLADLHEAVGIVESALYDLANEL